MDPFALAKRIESQARRLAELQAGMDAQQELAQGLAAHEREQADLRGRLQALEQAVADQKDAFAEVAAALGRERLKAEQLEDRLAEMLSSNSWKATAPARAVVSGVRVLLSRRQPGTSR